MQVKGISSARKIYNFIVGTKAPVDVFEILNTFLNFSTMNSRILSLLAAVLATILSVHSQNSGAGFRFVIRSDSTAAVSLSGNYEGSGEITIPSHVLRGGSTYRVTEIADSAFFGCMFSNISIPAGVERIGCYAFAECRLLSSIVLPEGLKYIGEGAFRGSCSAGAGELRLPSTLSDVGSEAFYDVPVRELDIAGDDSLGALYIGDKAFGGNEQHIETMTVGRGEPPTLADDAFTQPDYADTALYLYGAADRHKSDYLSDVQWSRFMNRSMVGVSTVEVDSRAREELYTLSGIPVSRRANLPRGIYILRRVDESGIVQSSRLKAL